MMVNPSGDFYAPHQPNSSFTSPGWYPAAESLSMERWWDGYQWTQNVRRIAAPALWPVVLVTLLAGIFGFIPAIIASVKASNTGHSVSQYWLTFVALWIPSMMLWYAVLGSST